MVKESCGVYGVYDRSGKDVFPYIYWGLLAQNHRGHQSYGFLTYGDGIHAHKELGLIPQIEEGDMGSWLRRIPGSLGIGHVRYACLLYTSDAADE